MLAIANLPTVKVPQRLWVVQPQYPLIRRILLPIYGRDQLIFLIGLGFVVVLLFAAFDRELALYMSVGGYVGAMLTMEVTTPSALLLPNECEKDVVELFDEAPFLKRTGPGDEWINARGRLYRWDSDTLRLERAPDGLLVTGGHRDLTILLEKLRSID